MNAQHRRALPRKRRTGPGVRHGRRPACRLVSVSTRRADFLFLLQRMSRKVLRRSRRGSATRRRARQRLPLGQSTHARCTRRFARWPAPARYAAWRWSRCLHRRKPRPIPSLRICAAGCGSGAILALPVVVLEMGAAFDRAGSLSEPVDIELGPDDFGDAGRAVGGLALLRAWMEFHRHSKSRYVHAHCDGYGRCLGVQRRRDPLSRNIPCWHSATGGGAVAVYFEAAAVITVLVLLGQVLELRARESTSGAIRALLDLAPKIAAPHPERRPGERRCSSIRSMPATG